MIFFGLRFRWREYVSEQRQVGTNSIHNVLFHFCFSWQRRVHVLLR